MLAISTLMIWKMNNEILYFVFSIVLGLYTFSRPYTFFGFYKMAFIIEFVEHIMFYISEYVDTLERL